MKIEVGKTYTTRDGHKVRIYAVDGIKRFHIHGAMLGDEGWIATAWDDQGDNVAVIAPSSSDITAEWTDKPDVPWDDYAKWWRFVAMDKGGQWWGYKNKPTIATINEWLGHDSYYISTRINPEHTPKFTGDWKESLVERPDK